MKGKKNSLWLNSNSTEVYNTTNNNKISMQNYFQIEFYKVLQQKYKQYDYLPDITYILLI